MLASIATQQEFRGRGIAKLLVRKTLASLRDIDIEKVGLGVVSTNAAAKAVYEAIGFKVVREFSRFSIRS
jgi:ribosomal protein S18 acetylase RimI-like enzyme